MSDTLDGLYSRMQMAGVNVERRDLTENEVFLRCVLATPYQMLEVNVYDESRKRLVTTTSLSYNIDCEPERDPNRLLRLVGNECWVALRYIGEYAQASAFTENVEDHLIPRPGRSAKDR
jgi:hypothetical protein